ncbi:MAG: CPBP family intramembrane metalloprotease [Anaerolineae bacterium]|nr:CPBP family intramembrane metalloprotease [Anaerolineae bacterium]
MSAWNKIPWFAALAVLAGTASLLVFGVFAPKAAGRLLPIALTGNEFVDGKLKYQIVTLVVSLLVLAVVYASRPANAQRFYRWGDMKAPAQAVGWLGIKTGDNWLGVGLNFAIIVSVATGAFIFFSMARGQSLEPGNARWLPWVLVLAASNAFVEEAITRLGVVTALDGALPRPWIYIISALVFAIPHFFGVPGGALGSLMAGFLGWLLAKSIGETGGMGWAWLIHFIQDIIIFGAMFLVAL